MIGFIDYDLIMNSKISIPNLEIMKLSAYLKAEQNQLCRLIDFPNEELNGYEKIYFFQETKGDIPREHLQNATNVEFKGLNFTNGIYLPFENPLIDFTIPRISIYKEYLQNHLLNGTNTKEINHFLDDTYYRMHAGKERLPIPPMVKRKRVFLYDVDFFYDDWRTILDKLFEHNPTSITRIYPVVCRSISKYFELRSYQKFSRTNVIYMDLPIPLDEMDKMFKKYELKLLGDITLSTQVYITFGGDHVTTTAFYKNFAYKLNVLYAFWSYGIPVKLKYVEPITGIKNPIPILSGIIENWGTINTETKQCESIIDRMPKKKKRIPVKAWEEYDTMIKTEPRLEQLFKQNFTDLQQSHNWGFC